MIQEVLRLMEDEKKEPIGIGTPKLFGIRKKIIQCLDHRALKSIFYGMHNLSVPEEMCRHMNPDEIISKYLAAGTLKKRNNHLKRDYSRNFIDIVKKMDRCGYSYIGNMAKQCRKKFSSNPGEQVKRLESLDSKVKEDFIASFLMPYRPSNAEEHYNANAFYDPNCDGRSKSVYVNCIYDILKERYKKSNS